MATWNDSSSSSSSSSDEDQECANVTLTTTTTDSDSENEEVKSELNSYSNLETAFNELLDESSKLAIEYKSLRKKFSNLEKGYEIFKKKENEGLKTENQCFISTVSNSLNQNNCSSLKYEKSFQLFLNEGLTRSKMASLIYGNNGNIGTNDLGNEEPLKIDKTAFDNSSSGSLSDNLVLWK